MKDFLGKKLSVGSIVILIAPSYRHLVRARVISFTDQKVRVEFNNTWNYGVTGHIQQILQTPTQLVKVDD